MRHRRLCLLFCAAILLACNQSVKATAFIQQDTLRQDTVSITPYFAKTPVNSLANFAVVKKDRYAFQTHAGFSVLNTLRGYMPGLNIGPNAGATGSGLRGTSSMLVIDGLPYYSTFYANYNLNSFDYENIHAVSSGNAAILYGGMASEGAVFLQSKTGKNIFKPSVEFSSFPTFISYDGPAFPYMEQLRFTNAIAYAQDYGAADLRVSYNGTYIPDTDKGQGAEIGLNNLRINTGVDITDRLNARLIIDGTKHKITAHPDQNEVLLFTDDESAKNLQGNLILQYQALDWLTITSQGALTGNDGESDYDYTGILVDQQRENRRSFLNLIASARHSLGNDLSLHEHAGVQYERQKQFTRRETTWGATTNVVEEKASNKTKSLLGGAGLQYRAYLFFDLNYRLDELTAYREDGAQHAYAVTSAFVFSEAFAWKNNWFSMGKLRGSYGKTTITPDKQGYTQPPFGNIIVNPDLSLLIRKRMVEAGADLSFFNHRLDLSFSYFHDFDDKLITYVPVPNVSNIVYTLMSIGELRSKGWEAVLSAAMINRGDLSLRTTLTWSRPGRLIAPEASFSEISVSSFNSWVPDWTGGLLNQLAIGNFFTTVLVDMRKGGDYYNYDLGMPVASYDGTNVMLRDLSVGYLWPETLNVKPRLSLSARNLWDIYTKDEMAEQHPLAIPPQKSISLSVTIGF